jgi:hypothetical protein
MASDGSHFLFYDTFNDTFDSNAQALKNLSSFPTFSTSVPVTPKLSRISMRDLIEDQTQLFSPCGCVLRWTSTRVTQVDNFK